jgi:hypothetical protein
MGATATETDAFGGRAYTQYAVKVGDFQWVRIPPGQLVARPEAIRAMKHRTVNASHEAASNISWQSVDLGFWSK